MEVKGVREGGRNKVSADGRRDEERRGWISDECSLITGAAEVQEPDVSNPVDTRGRAMGSGCRQGGEAQQHTRRRLMCSLAISEPIKKRKKKRPWSVGRLKNRLGNW